MPDFETGKTTARLPKPAASAVFSSCRKPGFRLAISLLATVMLSSLGPVGCTLWAAKQPPRSFQDTTSAEQHERLLWRLVLEKNWKKIAPVLAPNISYAANGRVIEPAGVVPYLQSLELQDFAVSNMTVEPNGADMVLRYHIQIQQPGKPPKTLVAISVWQKVHHGLLLIAHSQQPAASAGETGNPR